MSYDELEPGRELDALVWQALNGQEVNVLKCRYVGGDIQPHAGYPAGHISPPHYSTDIAAAWEVVEKMLEAYSGVEIYLENERCEVHCDGARDEWDDLVYIRGDTAPHAICIAALKAMEAEE
jgi:hypothetical protein